MTLYFRKAIADISDNRFLNAVTVVTIALSVMVFGAFLLFSINANDIVRSWEKGIRIMAYLENRPSPDARLELERKIGGLEGVESVHFISRDAGLSLLKKQLKDQSSLLDGFKENPLPDAFEVRVAASSGFTQNVASLAQKIDSFPHVESVEYGRKWLVRFSNIGDLFQMTSYAMGILFFMAAVFIVANTIRLVLYSRREEVEIMRMVGASDRFIKIPFYIEALLQGALGGIVGVLALLVVFAYLSSNVRQGITSTFFQIRFLPAGAIFSVIGCSMGMGLLGCYLSLKQFLK